VPSVAVTVKLTEEASGGMILLIVMIPVEGVRDKYGGMLDEAV
jgi:hypothetical protein